MDIEKAIRDFDLQMRPYAIICHPSVKEQIEQAVGNRYVVRECAWIEESKCYVVNREEYENMEVILTDGKTEFV